MESLEKNESQMQDLQDYEAPIIEFVEVMVKGFDPTSPPPEP